MSMVRAFWMENCSDLAGFRFEVVPVPVSPGNSGKAEAFPERLSTVNHK